MARCPGRARPPFGCGHGQRCSTISCVLAGEKLVFSDAEMRRRRAAFGAELERSGVSYALVYGANRSGSAVSWLTGWPVTREALLVAGPGEEEDVLLVSFFNHVPQARRLSTVRVEWAGARAVATALDLIAARGRLPGRIGLPGGGCPAGSGWPGRCRSASTGCWPSRSPTWWTLIRPAPGCAW